MVLSVTLDAAKCDLDFLELLPVSLHVRIVQENYSSSVTNNFLSVIIYHLCITLHLDLYSTKTIRYTIVRD